MSQEEAKLFKCRRCGKEKKEGEGHLTQDGETFCCKRCCGDDGQDKEKKRDGDVCEFC